MTTVRRARREGGAFGRVLGEWRRQRRLSQLALALASAVSQQHISFPESGRAQPSRDMVLRPVAGWLIERVHREPVADGQSDTTMALLREVLAYPDVPRAWEVPHWEMPLDPLLTLSLAKDDRVLHLFSTITTFGTPLDMTLQELRIECFFPADETTGRTLKSWLLMKTQSCLEHPGSTLTPTA